MRIEVKELTMKHRNKIALDHLSFDMEGPAIIGFLGHNGAGKTSFLNILAGLVVPTEGRIEIDGRDVFNNAQVMQQICFIAETGNFPQHVTVAQVLKMNSFFYPNWNEEIANELLIQFSLNKKDKVKTMSKGMQSALGIITGLASEAPITIFDEPYIGMDASGRSLFYDLLVEQQLINPRTFILSTHLIDEVSSLIEDVYIMHEGKLILHEAYDQLQSQVVKARGKAEDIEAFAAGGKVIQRSTFMNEHTAVIMLEQETDIAVDRIKLEPVKLQELLIMLSKNKRREL